MRTHLLTALLAMNAMVGFAQGTINVGNGIAATRFPIYGPDPNLPWGGYVSGNSPLSQPPGPNIYGGPLLQGSRYQIEFWAGPASAIDFSGLALITTMSFRTATADVLPAGLTVTVAASVPGVLPGSGAKLGVRVWDTVSGSTFNMAAYRGQSPLFLVWALGGTAPNGDLYTNPNWVGESFNLNTVPEPSAMACTGLGAVCLLLARRRNRLGKAPPGFLLL